MNCTSCEILVKVLTTIILSSYGCTHSHNHFTALWTSSETTQVSRHQKVPFAIFWIFWSTMKITQADASTIWMDCHPSRLIVAPTSAIPTIFTQDALRYTTLPIYPGLEQAPSMLACIPGGLRRSCVSGISGFGCNKLNIQK